jgi:Tfp pilus assembly protein PilN
MSQQINLINPALIKQKDFLTTLNITLVYAALALSLLGWYAYTAQQMTTLKMSRDQLANELQQVQTVLAEMTAARAPKAPNQTLITELQTLEEKHQVQMQILQAMQQGRPSQDKGLASYMLGLARQSTDGLWLTGFSIDQTHHTVSLKGRSMDAAVLPDYIRKLGREAVFSGQTFGGLRIQQANEVLAITPSENPPPAGQAQVIGATTLPTPVNTRAPFVEFELQASESSSVTPNNTSVTASDADNTKVLKSS